MSIKDVAIWGASLALALSVSIAAGNTPPTDVVTLRSTVQSAKRPQAPRTVVYYVYFYELRDPRRREYLVNSYTNYSTALRVVRSMNENPNIRAYVRQK